jgi:hypothetical protein
LRGAAKLFGSPRFDLTQPGMDTDKFDSPYYPPRARWWGCLFSPWFKLRCALHLERIRLPACFTAQQLLLGLLLPGHAFFANGRRTLGWAFVGVYVCSALLCVVAMGYQIGSLGFGLMISAHASSIVFMEGQWLRPRCQFPLRLTLAIVTVVLVWMAVYSPARSFAETHLVMPLRVRGNVVIVQRLTPSARIKRGDWVMSRLQVHNPRDVYGRDAAVWIDAGFSWGPVLAVAGDTVVFSMNSFSVNGLEQARLRHMPVSGKLVVPEKHWFVWPELAIRQWNMSEETLSDLMLQLATVSETEFIGKPFTRWFWRKQEFHEPIRQS